LAGFGGSLRGKMLRDAKSLKREALKLTAEHTDDADATDEKAISVAIAPQKIVEAAGSAALHQIHM
jgi:hypothetical protein